jgi:hypothetical protein
MRTPFRLVLLILAATLLICPHAAVAQPRKLAAGGK